MDRYKLLLLKFDDTKESKQLEYYVSSAPNGMKFNCDWFVYSMNHKYHFQDKKIHIFKVPIDYIGTKEYNYVIDNVYIYKLMDNILEDDYYKMDEDELNILFDEYICCHFCY
jgi:hypothetical protein